MGAAAHLPAVVEKGRLSAENWEEIRA